MIAPAFLAIGGGVYPTASLDFERSSSQSLALSNGDWGSYTVDKWSATVWCLRESVGTDQAIFSKGRNSGSAPGNEIRVYFNSNNKIDILTGLNDGRQVTTATYTSTSAWYHILIHYDYANVTAGDRMRLWVDGSEVTTFDTDTAPTSGYSQNTSDPFIWGANLNAAASSRENHYDGLLYQPAFFDNELVSISDVYEGGLPARITGLTGLYSLLDVNGSVTNDFVKSAVWTNNSSVTSSATGPWA